MAQFQHSLEQLVVGELLGSHDNFGFAPSLCALALGTDHLQPSPTNIQPIFTHTQRNYIATMAEFELVAGVEAVEAVATVLQLTDEDYHAYEKEGTWYVGIGR
jgi:hypothetical protein